MGMMWWLTIPHGLMTCLNNLHGEGPFFITHLIVFTLMLVIVCYDFKHVINCFTHACYGLFDFKTFDFDSTHVLAIVC